MNIVSRFIAFVHTRALELLLAISSLLLIGQLCWLPVVHWWYLPGPGQIGFDSFEAKTLASEFVIQLPPRYRNGQLWPLVVFLHGSAERGNDSNVLRNENLFRQKFPAIVAAPQCLPTFSWEPNAVADLIQYVALRYHVDRNRIYLVGHSMGGYGTWDTAAAHPDLFAAIVPISGGGDPNNVKPLAGIPAWAFHGKKDKTVPVAESERMIEAIREAGGEPKLTVIPNAGHGICQAVCDRANLWEWLFQQRRRQK
jgi:predicted peptidase